MARTTPFPFLLDELYPFEPVIRLMFGCQALYRADKILLILRDRADHTDANGIWIATSAEHHESLRMEFPSMHSIGILSGGKGETAWQMISMYDEDFETSAVRLCELIKNNDERIGKIPKQKKKKKR